MTKQFRALDDEELIAVRAFARTYGRKWKKELAQVYWYNARLWQPALNEHFGSLLHGLRNSHGPAWLDAYQLPVESETAPAETRLRFHPTAAEPVEASAAMDDATFKRSSRELRERWLSDLAALMAPVICERGGVNLPPYRVTCGFPSSGGKLGKKSRTRGECWSAEASADGHAEIFISPVEHEPETIAAILAHELIHAALPHEGHKGGFVRVAKAIGHEAPFTTSHPTDAFLAWAGQFIRQVGAYPHASLNAQDAVGAKKKQTTRMLKAECADCGYTARVTRKWVVEKGAPICPCNRQPMVCDLGDDFDEDDYAG